MDFAGLIDVRICVVAVSAANSAVLLADALKTLLEEKHQLLILRELAGHFDDYEALHGIRSRQSGSQVYIELFLEFDPHKPVGEVQRVVNHITESLQSKIPNSRVSVALTDRPTH